MEQFEYLIPFVGIIYALSATDLLVSTHKIIVARRSISFHAVPFIWAIVAYLLMINGWWGFLQINNQIELKNAGQLVFLSVLPLSVFLIASLSLPHNFESDLNMWEYFSEHKTPLYICHAVYMLLIPLVLGSFAKQFNYEQVLKNLVIAVALLVLIRLRHWLWHFVAGAAFMSVLLQSLFEKSVR